jgi:hypothetical protein
MNASTPPAPPRRLSLLLGPWHTSSRVVAVLVLLFLVFCNLPGQQVDRLSLVDDPFFQSDYYRERFEHGWPLTYIDRDSPAIFGGYGTVSECWRFWQGFLGDIQVSWTSLLVNVLVISLIAVASGALFELRRRKRSRLVQFSLLGMLALFAVISCCGAWYAAERQELAREKALLDAGPSRTLISLADGSPFTDHSISVRKSSTGGITWLRRLCGDRWFEFLDRPIYVDAATSALPAAARFSEVQILRLDEDVTNEDLVILESFPQLQVIEFGFSKVRDRSGEISKVIELPKLPALLGLNLEDPFDSRGQIRGLTKLKSLEAANLDHCELDAEGMRDLGSLTHLRELSLADARIPADGCRHLQNLSNLRRLVIARTSLGAESLQSIGGLTELRELYLCQTAPPAGALGHLRHLTKLEVLNLAGCQVTFADIAQLKDLHQLELLNLSDVPITFEQRQQLEKWFPNCEFR